MTTPLHANIQSCRSCGSPLLRPYLKLGTLPLSGHLLRKDQLGFQEPRYPLEVALCETCYLSQLLYTVPPTEVFATEYPYYSSVSSTWVAHCQRNVEALVERFHLGREHLAIEIASNDGYLLQHFKAANVRVLGIDPAEGPAKVAIAKGIPTVVDFFTKKLAEQMVITGHAADVVIGCNVLAHVAETNDFVAGVARVLKPSGIAVFEFPHLLKLIEHCEFDTIYHEHLCYFSLHAVQALFTRHGLTVFDVEQLPTHGGSLRLYATLNPAGDRSSTPAVEALLQLEALRGLQQWEPYANFAGRVAQVQIALREFLVVQKALGRDVVAYGAAAKGGTLLNASGITTDLLSYVVDKSPMKQGRYMTGSRLPVLAPERLLQDQPDYAVLLTWNFKDEILAQQDAYRQKGGKFVLPIPKLEII